MSIATDAKAYADAAVEQGKQALNQAQTVAAQAYTELRSKSESLLASAKHGEVKGLDADTVNAVKAKVAPFVSQAKVIGGVVTDKADELRKDPRVAKAVTGAETVANTVHERLVQPMLNLAGIGSTQAKVAKKPTGTKPAQTKPAETTLHAVKPTKTTTARAPRKTTATKSATTSNDSK